MGCLRTRDAGIPRRCPATRRHGPRCDRAGVNLRLGALRREDWPGHRHAYFWSIRTAEGLAAGVRVHRRSCHGDGQGAVATIESRIAWPTSGNPGHHVRLSMPGLLTHRPILPATGRRSGLTSASGLGARYAKTTAPTARRGNISPTSTRARALIVGTRMVSPASVTVTSASVSHWRSGTGAI